MVTCTRHKTFEEFQASVTKHFVSCLSFRSNSIVVVRFSIVHLKCTPSELTHSNCEHIIFKVQNLFPHRFSFKYVPGLILLDLAVHNYNTV